MRVWKKGKFETKAQEKTCANSLWSRKGGGGGIKKPINIEKSTNKYRDEEDIFKQFINEKCERGEELKVFKDELIRRFSTYCFNYGEKKSTLSKTKVTLRLKEMGIGDSGKGKSKYTGIRMIEEEGQY